MERNTFKQPIRFLASHQVRVARHMIVLVEVDNADLHIRAEAEEESAVQHIIVQVKEQKVKASAARHMIV